MRGYNVNINIFWGRAFVLFFCLFFFFQRFIIYFIYFWLRWIFRCGVWALRCSAGFSLVVPCGVFSSLVVAHRLQGMWSLQLWHVGSRARGLCSLRHTGSLVEARKLSSCGTRAQLPCDMRDLSSLTRERTHVPLDCKADSLPLDYQGSPCFLFLNFRCTQ